jgi:hypothetical protein
MDTALATNEWQTFTERYWEVEPLRFDYAPRGPGGPTLRAIGYADRKGRLLLPPYQPHLPLEFKPTPTDAPYRLQRQWLETSRCLVDDMLARGIRGELTFSPAVADPRPWQWSWFRVLPRFTNFIDFPFTLDQADRVMRQQANKAARAGFVCRKTDHIEDALACLSGSESRRGFRYGMTLQGLEMAHRLLGPECLRVYVAYAAGGEPATARVVLHRPGGRACDWLAGTMDKHLHGGATQLLMAFMFDDLQQAGAAGYNSCGADVEPVAYAKSMWGGRLMTQFSVLAYDYRPMKNLLGNARRYLRRQREVRRAQAAARRNGADAKEQARPGQNGETAGAPRTTRAGQPAAVEP